MSISDIPNSGTQICTCGAIHPDIKAKLQLNFRCVLSGVSFVPVDPGYPQDRVGEILKETNAEVVVVSEGFVPEWAEALMLMGGDGNLRGNCDGSYSNVTEKQSKRPALSKSKQKLKSGKKLTDKNVFSSLFSEDDDLLFASRKIILLRTTEKSFSPSAEQSQRMQSAAANIGHPNIGDQIDACRAESISLESKVVSWRVFCNNFCRDEAVVGGERSSPRSEKCKASPETPPVLLPKINDIAEKCDPQLEAAASAQILNLSTNEAITSAKRLSTNDAVGTRIMSSQHLAADASPPPTRTPVITEPVNCSLPCAHQSNTDKEMLTPIFPMSNSSAKSLQKVCKKSAKSLECVAKSL